MAILTVYENGNRRNISAVPGRTILSALRESGILSLEATCNGASKCGKCLVKAEGELSAPEDSEQRLLPSEAGTRLACQARVTGDCFVYLFGHGEAEVISAGKSLRFPTDNVYGRGLGAAVDIGTTTVVLYLYDLATGEQLSLKSGMNEQRAFGADVISRIQYGIDEPDGLSRMASVIRGQINGYLKSACEAVGRKRSELLEMTVAGNTVMEHIFAGISPTSIAFAPFMPLSLFGNSVPSSGMELEVGPDTPIYLSPCVSGYVGGDITAGLLASGAGRSEGVCLFLDIGTNGEMALGNRDGFRCCSTAAGPAFEGAEITCGMSGVSGAVSRVRLENGALRLDVIGGGAPKGICGSGLADALAVLLKTGGVDETGRMLPADESPDTVKPYLGERDGRTVFYLDGDRTLFISDTDVRKLQLAKAAIAAGIQTLLKEADMTVDAVDTLYLAGGFGNYIDIDSAVTIGLIPGSLASKLVPVGNSAGMGAAAILVSATARAELESVKNRCKYLELSLSPAFNEYFIDCMMFK